MIRVKIDERDNGSRMMTIEGHADESEYEHENIGVCAMVSFLAQGCAMWTEDDSFVFDDGHTAVQLPTGDVGEFVVNMFHGIAGAFPALLAMTHDEREAGR